MEIARGTTVESMGFAIEETRKQRTPYILRGPRNTEYALSRCHNDASILLVNNMRRGHEMGIANIKGFQYFKENNGTIEAWA